MTRTALYPGTFDPITEGHVDMIEAGLKCFDKVIICIMWNPLKPDAMFGLEDRLTMINLAIADRGLDADRVEVTSVTEGLSVNAALQHGATAMIRGLRMTTDYDYELSLALNNALLSNEVQTVMFPPAQVHMHISSTGVRSLIQVREFEKLRGYVTESVCKYVTALCSR